MLTSFEMFLALPGSRSGSSETDSDPAKWHGSVRIRIRNTGYNNEVLWGKLQLTLLFCCENVLTSVLLWQFGPPRMTAIGWFWSIFVVDVKEEGPLKEKHHHNHKVEVEHSCPTRGRNASRWISYYGVVMFRTCISATRVRLLSRASATSATCARIFKHSGATCVR